MNYLTRIDEKVIKSKGKLIGLQDVFDRCVKIIDLIHRQDKNYLQLCDELDIRSINLFYGETGTGKTTLSYSLANYALEKYEIETYAFQLENIIKTELGATVSNFKKACEEVQKLCDQDKGIILFLDEFDRFSVNRSNNNEVSELKRLLISLMDFLQSISIKHKISILATTNNIDTLDPALKRRFSFHYKIKCSDEAKSDYIKKLIDLIPKDLNYKIDEQNLKNQNTIADIKEKVRDNIINIINVGEGSG